MCSDDYSTDGTDPDMFPTADKDEYMAIILGCVLCSKTIVVVDVDPDSIKGKDRFPYSNDTRFIPVYCTPCTNVSFGFCRNARVSLKMLTGTDAYKKASTHTGLGENLRIYPVKCMFLIWQACSFLSDIKDGDVVMEIDEKANMGLRKLKNTDFFAKIKLLFEPDTSPESSDSE
jgi:hypothetical protein